MASQRELTLRLLLSAATLLACALVAEIGMRVYQRAAFGIPLTTAFPDWRVDPMPYSPFLAFGPRVDYEMPGKAEPALARFDSRGFRTVEEVLPKIKDEIRLVALGGSTTEDLWNSSGRHWPWLLEQHLQKSTDDRIRVLNGGMSAYATAHSLIRSSFDLPDLDADAVLVMHNINDLTAVYFAIAADRELDAHYAAKYLTRGYTGIRRDEDVVRSRFLRFLRGRLFPARVERPDVPDAPETLARGVELFSRNLRSIGAVARAHGVEPIFMTMPFSASEEHYLATLAGDVATGSVGIGPVPNHARLLRDLARYNLATIEVAAETGTTVIDMAALPWDKSHFVDIVHYSDAGSEAFAARLAEQLAPLLEALRQPSPR
jgi:lysophospholipase L1-like esterase